MQKKQFLDIIRTNINKNDYHITLVNGGQNPDFSYSIGLTEKLGFELIITGGGFVSVKDNEFIFRDIYEKLQSGYTIASEFLLSDKYVFYLTSVHVSWRKKLMLGVYDYYNVEEIRAYQITPTDRTLDTPLMSQVMNPNDPIWKWLDTEWNINAPKNSYVVTDRDALKGKPIIEIMRWEEQKWEMYPGPGPDVKEEDIMIVPLGTILGIDSTLTPILNLTIGQGLWRYNKDSNWQDW